MPGGQVRALFLGNPNEKVVGGPNRAFQADAIVLQGMEGLPDQVGEEAGTCVEGLVGKAIKPWGGVAGVKKMPDDVFHVRDGVGREIEHGSVGEIVVENCLTRAPEVRVAGPNIAPGVGKDGVDVLGFGLEDAVSISNARAGVTLAEKRAPDGVSSVPS